MDKMYLDINTLSEITKARGGTIDFCWSEDEFASCVVDWCPGDGTRYRAMFTNIDAELAERIPGLGERPGAMVSFMSPTTKCFPFIREGMMIHENYVAEKFEVGKGSAAAIAAMLNILLWDADTEYGIEVLSRVGRR